MDACLKQHWMATYILVQSYLQLCKALSWQETEFSFRKSKATEVWQVKSFVESHIFQGVFFSQLKISGVRLF